MERGKYFVVEGNDGTGKSTQVKRLASYLKEERGIDSFIAEEPAGTPIADEIRTIIKNSDLERDPETNLLLFTAARHEIWQRAKRELALGKYVLSARNYFSTLAYQGGGEGIDSSIILDITGRFTDDNYMHPDGSVILLLDDHKTRQERIANRGTLETPDTFESRDEAFQSNVNDTYRQIALAYNVPTINAHQSREAIEAEIRNVFEL